MPCQDFARKNLPKRLIANTTVRRKHSVVVFFSHLQSIKRFGVDFLARYVVLLALCFKAVPSGRHHATSNATQPRVHKRGPVNRCSVLAAKTFQNYDFSNRHFKCSALLLNPFALFTAGQLLSYAETREIFNASRTGAPILCRSQRSL